MSEPTPPKPTPRNMTLKYDASTWALIATYQKRVLEERGVVISASLAVRELLAMAIRKEAKR